VKLRLDRFEYEDPDDLLEVITEILGTMQTDGLRGVLQRWIDRARIVAGGTEATYLIKQFISTWRFAIFVQWG
jgi:hypothetical protein